jgi:MFS family permease
MDPHSHSDRSILRLAAIVSLGGFVFGYDAVVISGAIEPVAQRFALSAWHQGLLVATPTLTAIFGTLLAGPLSDRYGRKTLLLAVAGLYIISALASAFAVNAWMLTLSRGLGGLAFSSLVLGPLYISETAAARHRGQMVSMNQIAIVIGLSVAYFSNLAVTSLSFQDETGSFTLLGIQSWRWMFALELLPAMLWLAALIGIPETPRWLLTRDRPAEARTLLEKLHGLEHARRFFDRLEPDLHAEREKKQAILAILKSRIFALTFLIAIIVAVAQQITGVNAIYFYAPTVFHQAGAGINASLLQASVIGVLNLGFTFLAFFLVDRVGRRPLLLGGLIGIVISMMIVGAGFSQAHYLLPPDALARLPVDLQPVLAPLVGQSFETDLAYNASLHALLSEEQYRQHHNLLLELAVNINAPLILFGLCLFVASFASSLGPVMWVFLSEIFPGPVRGIAIAAAAALNSLTSFLVQLAFPVELEVIGAAATFWLYAGFAAGFAILVWRFVPETKGRHLEDIQSIFGGRQGHD